MIGTLKYVLLRSTTASVTKPLVQMLRSDKKFQLSLIEHMEYCNIRNSNWNEFAMKQSAINNLFREVYALERNCLLRYW